MTPELARAATTAVAVGATRRRPGLPCRPGSGHFGGTRRIPSTPPGPAVTRSSDPPTSPDLIQAIQAGDERALGTLYDLHSPSMYALAGAIVREDADAEEVVADVFLSVWRNPDAYDPTRGSLGAYLTVMTRSKALDRVRARRRRRRAEERSASVDPSGIATPMGEAGPSPDDRVDVAEMRALLEPALGALPEAQQEAIALAYLGGYSHSEIADALSEPLGTVKTRIRTGMAKLRDALLPTKGGVGS